MQSSYLVMLKLVFLQRLAICFLLALFSVQAALPHLHGLESSHDEVHADYVDPHGTSEEDHEDACVYCLTGFRSRFQIPSASIELLLPEASRLIAANAASTSYVTVTSASVSPRAPPAFLSHV